MFGSLVCVMILNKYFRAEYHSEMPHVISSSVSGYVQHILCSPTAEVAGKEGCIQQKASNNKHFVKSIHSTYFD